MAQGDAGPADGSPALATGAVHSDPHARPETDASTASASPLEGLFWRYTTSFRRRMIAGTVVAVLVLAGVSILFAWRQYDHASSSAFKDLQARVVSVGGIVDVAFAGDVALLETAARTPVVVGGDLPGMERYFRSIQSGPGRSLTGGLAWVDTSGTVEIRGTGGIVHVDVHGRAYFEHVLRTGAPYVSSGIVGRLTHKPLIVIAVPTYDAAGRLSGVLTGSVLLATSPTSREALALGFGGLDVIDGNGRLLLDRLAPVANRALVARMRRAGSGVFADTAGLDGHGSDAVAFAVVPSAGWLVVIDRSRATVLAPAWHALLLDLASVGGAVVLVLVLLVYVARRTRRDADDQEARARAWSGLTRTLAAASTSDQVADALLAALCDAMPSSVAVVGLDHGGDIEARAASRVDYGRRIVGDETMLGHAARLGAGGPRSQRLEQTSRLRLAYTLSGRRLRALHSLPITTESGRRLGTISVLTAQPRLDASVWTLMQSFAEQAGAALSRARLFEREHDLALRLQRSLLPDRLPATEGVELAAHYHAGVATVEVGGDWYDAVRRPDGILELCVGDVSGRGVGAATIMGRQRNIFRAYAFESPSPAEIIRRMLRHVDSDDMITVACVALDLYTGELAYSCAGHPPPLLFEHASGEVRRLDDASAPPIGVADPADVVEARLRLDGPATLALYTDGLIERRGMSIDASIDLLAGVLADEHEPTPDGILARVSAMIGEPVDDVALLLVAVQAERAGFELDIPAEAAALPGIRRRLRGWLEREQIPTDDAAEIVLAVSEACNNAIEHAYRGHAGRLRISLVREPDELRVVVEDDGRWRDERPSDDRGRGMSLMRNLMDTMEVETGPLGTRIRLERRVRAHGGADLAPTRVSS